MILDARALARFASYFELLRRWNARINLTRIDGDDDVVSKHFLDSLAIVPLLGAVRDLVDVGAGAGFPGVAAAVALPELRVTLVEATHKKCAFLEALKRELALDLEVVPRRLEEFTGDGRQFGAAVSRATFAPSEWVERGAPLVAPAGLLIAMLGRERGSLPPPPGFLPAVYHDYRLPVEGARALAVFRRGPPG